MTTRPPINPLAAAGCPVAINRRGQWQPPPARQWGADTGRDQTEKWKGWHPGSTLRLWKGWHHNCRVQTHGKPLALDTTAFLSTHRKQLQLHLSLQGTTIPISAGYILVRNLLISLEYPFNKKERRAVAATLWKGKPYERQRVAETH